MNTIKTLTPFQQKAIDFSKHISLTANAGSGKTFVLSNRFVEIAVNQDIPLSSIIAITFTDKAAGELYKKIAEEIDLRLANEKEYKILRRLEEIRRHLVSSNISTIHSFCINVLKEFSPEAGIDANFSPADETLSNELLDLSIEELFNIHNSEMDLDERVKQLIRYFGSKTLLVERLRKLLKNRKNVLEIESQIYSQDLDTIEKHFELEFEEKILQILPNISDFVSVVETINNKVKDGTINDNTIDVDNAVSTIRNSQKITEKLNSIVKIKKTIITKTGVRSVKYLSKKNRAGLDNEIESITKYFREFDKLKYSDVDASLNRELAVFGKLVLEVFDFVLSIYDEKKKKLSVLDFEEIGRAHV